MSGSFTFGVRLRSTATYWVASSGIDLLNKFLNFKVSISVVRVKKPSSDMECPGFRPVET